MNDIRVAFERAKKAASEQTRCDLEQWRSYNGALNAVIVCPLCQERVYSAQLDTHFSSCVERPDDRANDDIETMLARCVRWQGAPSAVESPALARTLDSTVAHSLAGSPYACRVLAFCAHWCLRYERHLIHETEIQSLSDFESLSPPSQWLYARLFFRKDFAVGRWFRASALRARYRDIDVEKAIQELCQRGFLKDRPTSTEEYLGLAKSLTKLELRLLGKELGLRSACMLITSISGTCFPHVGNRLTRTRRALERQALPAVCGVKEKIQAFFTTWTTMIPFGIEYALRHGLDLRGRLPVCSVTEALFSSRAELERYAAACELERSFQAASIRSAAMALDLAEKAEKMLREIISAPAEANPENRITRYDQLTTLSRLYRDPHTCTGVLSNVLWHSIPSLESSGQFAGAANRLGLLLHSNCSLRRRGKFYDRLSLIYMNRMNDLGKALVLCKDAQFDEFVRPVEREILSKRAARISSRLGLSAEFGNESIAVVIPERFLQGRALETGKSRGAGVRFAGFDNTLGVSVETLALQFYESELGFHGAHLEGCTFEALFLICFGDFMNLPIPDVFHAPCQTLPLDFGTEVFYINRREAIQRRLTELSLLTEADLTAWVSTQLVHYQTLIAARNPRLVQVPWSIVIAGLGGRSLVRILALLVTDYHYWRSGAPDLLLWQVNGGPRCKLVEVKSANDSLAAKQRYWLRELVSAGVDAELCYVREHMRHPKHLP
ncbi:hypothetical protein CCYA_CCYA02G0590 [Cyanidiococcus yangmingshanensis]|nr:hypothetical protein CCYA_CCYA02G0590 [Cyanidiococcus yangmingshanensis]